MAIYLNGVHYTRSGRIVQVTVILVVNQFAAISFVEYWMIQLIEEMAGSCNIFVVALLRQPKWAFLVCNVKKWVHINDDFPKFQNFVIKHKLSLRMVPYYMEPCVEGLYIVVGYRNFVYILFVVIFHHIKLPLILNFVEQRVKY